MRTDKIIGYWIELESRDVHRSHTSYAADWEILRTTPGEYPVMVSNIQGAPVRNGDRPYYLVINIDATRIAGRTYSGFAGNNFSHNALPLESKSLMLRPYFYTLDKLVEQGQIRLI